MICPMCARLNLMKKSLNDTYEHYKKVFSTSMNRFDMKCPDCQQGCNSAAAGGNERCFHCDNCDLIECLVTSPVLNGE
jgi:hypothetical protein